MTEWGWTSYRRLGWQTKDGRKFYEGHFRKEYDPFSWTLQIVKFWALHPVKAMSAICRSGKEPKEFVSETIN
jgi:hypothetical protein